ncbi:MAG TPA: GNAT family N-acetyltransferase [Gaiellaceae bacterium]|nr:GNAT family N-acetyltransferase [Gaiellaceae bacterium]
MTEFETEAELPAADYLRLREAVGWRSVDCDEPTLRASLALTWNVVAREDGEVVGIGRLLDDGAFYATVWDVIVVPEAQRRGIGTAILELLLERAAGRSIVALVASPAGKPLYERYGFSSDDGRGVAMLMRPNG